MRKSTGFWLSICVAVVCCALVSEASIKVALGVRETGTNEPIGANGGTAQGIEWVGGNSSDGVLVPTYGVWQVVSFDLINDPVQAFAGATANGILETTGLCGTIEHLAFVRTTSAGPFKIFIDDIVQTINGVPTLITGFENVAVGGQEMFRWPTFSGSTAGQLETTPNVTEVTAAEAYTGDQSLMTQFQWTPSGSWLRLTTFGAPNTPNPTIHYGGEGVTENTVSFAVMVIPEPTTMALLGIAGLALIRRRRR